MNNNHWGLSEAAVKFFCFLCGNVWLSIVLKFEGHLGLLNGKKGYVRH